MVYFYPHLILGQLISSYIILKITLDIIKFIVIAFLKYNLEPILSPQKINTKDIVLIFENLVRSSIYIVIFVFSFNINNLKNNIYVAILLVLLFTEMVWSLGTNNWGTASRHHIPSAGLILICISIILNGKFNEKKIMKQLKIL